MAKKGFDQTQLLKYLEQLNSQCGDAKKNDAIMKQVLYEGAGVYADALREAASAHGSLSDYVNLTQMVKGSGWSTNLGFAGLTENGYPAAKIAAVLEYGTSEGSKNGQRNKQPFIRSALKSVQGKAQEAMNAKFEELINELMEV